MSVIQLLASQLAQITCKLKIHVLSTYCGIYMYVAATRTNEQYYVRSTSIKEWFKGCSGMENILVFG